MVISSGAKMLLIYYSQRDSAPRVRFDVLNKYCVGKHVFDHRNRELTTRTKETRMIVVKPKYV